MLAFEGLVRTERNRGAFVANPSPEEARQVFRFAPPDRAGHRHAPPPSGSRTADIAALPRAAAGGEPAACGERGPSARRAEIKASGDFHLLLAAVAGNAILQRFMEELVARSSLVIALYGRSGASSCGHAEHWRHPRRARSAATASAPAT